MDDVPCAFGWRALQMLHQNQCQSALDAPVISLAMCVCFGSRCQAADEVSDLRVLFSVRQFLDATDQPDGLQPA